MSIDPANPPIGEPVEAWDLIGFDGTAGGSPATVRLARGHARYEAVDNVASWQGERCVRLARLETRPGMTLRQVDRWVRPSCPLVVELDDVTDAGS